jgi:hypothetical protein
MFCLKLSTIPYHFTVISQLPSSLFLSQSFLSARFKRPRANILSPHPCGACMSYLRYLCCLSSPHRAPQFVSLCDSACHMLSAIRSISSGHSLFIHCHFSLQPQVLFRRTTHGTCRQSQYCSAKRHVFELFCCPSPPFSIFLHFPSPHPNSRFQLASRYSVLRCSAADILFH